MGLYFGQVRELPQRFSKSQCYADIRDQEDNRIYEEKDDALFSRFVPLLSSLEPEAQLSAKKRVISEVYDLLLRI